MCGSEAGSMINRDESLCLNPEPGLNKCVHFYLFGVILLEAAEGGGFKILLSSLMDARQFKAVVAPQGQ